MAPSFQFQPTRAASDRPASLGPRRRYAAIAPSVRLSLMRRRQELVAEGRAKLPAEPVAVRLGGDASRDLGECLFNHDRDAL